MTLGTPWSPLSAGSRRAAALAAYATTSLVFGPALIVLGFAAWWGLFGGLFRTLWHGGVGTRSWRPTLSAVCADRHPPFRPARALLRNRAARDGTRRWVLSQPVRWVQDPGGLFRRLSRACCRDCGRLSPAGIEPRSRWRKDSGFSDRELRRQSCSVLDVTGMDCSRIIRALLFFSGELDGRARNSVERSRTSTRRAGGPEGRKPSPCQGEGRGVRIPSSAPCLPLQNTRWKALFQSPPAGSKLRSRSLASSAPKHESRRCRRPLSVLRREAYKPGRVPMS